MRLAPRLPIAFATGLLCIAIPIAVYAAPGSTRPSDPISRPVTGGHVSGTAALTPTPTPSDTLGKSEKGKAERGNPAPKKKLLKGRQAAPAATSDPRQFIPDQPWETEFFVDNDVTRPPPHPVLLLASSRR